jgi:hypothetical protein
MNLLCNKNWIDPIYVYFAGWHLANMSDCVNYPVIQVDFTAKPTYWKPLYPPIKEKLGELLVSLTYHPAKNTLTIVILKAKNLKAKDINGKSG